jgi:hypothetical protein
VKNFFKNIFYFPKTKSPRFHPVAEILFGVEEKKEKIMKKRFVGTFGFGLVSLTLMPF